MHRDMKTSATVSCAKLQNCCSKAEAKNDRQLQWLSYHVEQWLTCLMAVWWYSCI